jgi:hypothetical protein
MDLADPIDSVYLLASGVANQPAADSRPAGIQETVNRISLDMRVGNRWSTG